MSNVVRFPARLRPIQPITAEQIEIRDALILTMAEKPVCRDCAGTGWKIGFRHLAVDLLDAFERSPCPCGGTDEDRIDLNDFGGAA